jgi:acetyltransferase-like isoleucine patch superfamily enzyme
MLSKIGLILYYITRIFAKLSTRFWTFVVTSYLQNKSKSCGTLHVHGFSRIMNPQFLEMGENITININAYWVCDGGIKIGDNAKIARNCTIYTRNHNHKGIALPFDHTNNMRPVVIGDNVWIGTNVTILPGTVIGDGAIIGAGSVVFGKIPPLAIMGAAGPIKVAERDREHYYDLLEKRHFGGLDGKLITYPKNDIAP